MRLGVTLAMSAVAVNGPLLVLALLAADGVAVPTSWRILLLSVRALGTVIVLSLGAAYIAHAAVVHRSARRVLIAIWLLVLIGTSAIVTPMVVGAVGPSLAPVIPSVTGRWVWALVSVVTVEVAAAGCMLAAGVATTTGSSQAGSKTSAQAGAEAATRLAGAAARQAPYVQPVQPVERPELAMPQSIDRSQGIRCAFCDRAFRSSFALGGHLRHCNARKSAIAPSSDLTVPVRYSMDEPASPD